MNDSPLAAGSQVWAYLRVSGEDQAERGMPIAGQRAEVQRYCDHNSLVLARWFVDEARPGAMSAPGPEGGRTWGGEVSDDDIQRQKAVAQTHDSGA